MKSFISHLLFCCNDLDHHLWRRLVDRLPTIILYPRHFRGHDPHYPTAPRRRLIFLILLLYLHFAPAMRKKNSLILSLLYTPTHTPTTHANPTMHFTLFSDTRITPSEILKIISTRQLSAFSDTLCLRVQVRRFGRLVFLKDKNNEKK